MGVNSTCVVILGGHRCGTSAVAGVLKKLGVFMGHRFVGKTPFNKKGHWEDVAFLTLHKRIVGGWKRPCVDFQPVRKAYVRLIRSRERNFPLWGFKDPRFVFVFPHFLTVAESRILAISVYRDLGASVESMVDRHKPGSSVNVGKMDAVRIARRYRDAHWAALRGFRGPSIAVQYEDLVKQPAKHVSRIAKFVGLPVATGAIEFIEPGLRHF